MKHYRAPDGSIHAFEDDGSQDYLIRKDMVAMTAEQLAQARAPVVDAKAEAMRQIRTLEQAEMAPRFVRESLLETARFLAVYKGTAAGLTEAQSLALLTTKNPGYIRLKALDDEIDGLRAVVRGDA